MYPRSERTHYLKTKQRMSKPVDETSPDTMTTTADKIVETMMMRDVIETDETMTAVEITIEMLMMDIDVEIDMMAGEISGRTWHLSVTRIEMRGS
jgi:propanediol dehydratase small subunit